MRRIGKTSNPKRCPANSKGNRRKGTPNPQTCCTPPPDQVLSCSRALSVVPKLIWPSIRAFICGRYQSTTEYQTPHSGIVPVRTISNSVTTVTQYSLFQPSICELSPTQRLSPNSSRCFLNHNQTTLENECERYPPRWMIITHSLLT